MGRLEIIVLITTILVTAILISFILNKVFKQTKNEVKNLPKKESKQPVKEVEKQETEIVSEEQVENKAEVKAEEKVPEVSTALLDDLNEFKAYLKERITPSQIVEEAPKYSYDAPKLSQSRYDDILSQFDDDGNELEYNYRRPLDKVKSPDDLTTVDEKLKILMMIDFFNTKF